MPTAGQENHGPGRRRCYGDLLPSPEEFRREERIPWLHIQAFASGQVHDFAVKFITPLRWKHAGGDRLLSLLIIRPVAYRRPDTVALSANSKSTEPRTLQLRLRSHLRQTRYRTTATAQAMDAARMTWSMFFWTACQRSPRK